MRSILLIIGGLIIGLIFNYLRSKIIKNVKTNITENFNTSKLREGLFAIRNKVLWAKDIAQLFNIRKIFIYLLIAGVIYGVGWYRGIQGKPVHFNLDYDKEFALQLDGQTLYKPKGSTQLEVRDEKGNRIKVISARDIPQLKERLKPFGFQIEPIFVVGGGMGAEGLEGEVGVGVSFLRYWRNRLEGFLTQKGIYIGTSYMITEDSGAGISIGKGFEGDNRVLLYYRFKF